MGFNQLGLIYQFQFFIFSGFLSNCQCSNRFYQVSCRFMFIDRRPIVCVGQLMKAFIEGGKKREGSKIPKGSSFHQKLLYSIPSKNICSILCCFRFSLFTLSENLFQKIHFCIDQGLSLIISLSSYMHPVFY